MRSETLDLFVNFPLLAYFLHWACNIEVSCFFLVVTHGGVFFLDAVVLSSFLLDSFAFGCCFVVTFVCVFHTFSMLALGVGSLPEVFVVFLLGGYCSQCFFNYSYFLMTGLDDCFFLSVFFMVRCGGRQGFLFFHVNVICARFDWDEKYLFRFTEKFTQDLFKKNRGPTIWQATHENNDSGPLKTLFYTS